MNGPIDLTREAIDRNITKEKIGGYILGLNNKYAKYVGRSDKSLNSRLKDHVGEKYRGETYRFFWYQVTKTVREAFDLECKWFHQYGGTSKLANERHPKSPPKTDWKCPECGASKTAAEILSGR